MTGASLGLRSAVAALCASSLVYAQAAPKKPAKAPAAAPAPKADPKAAPPAADAVPTAPAAPTAAAPTPAAPTRPPPAATPGRPPPGWPAHYAPRPYWPPPGYVPVVIQGEPSPLTVSLAYDKKSAPIVQCGGDCTVYVPPREYWITVEETGETLKGKRSVEVNGPTRLEVEPRTKSDSSTGLAMGIGGIGLIVVGTVAMMAGLVQSIDHDLDRNNNRNNSDDGTSLLLLGLAGFTAGAVLTPIGWVKYGRRAPAVSVHALPAQR